jgi:hypothetical protein
MANNSTLYSYCSTLAVGCPVWTTPDRTVVASNGIYSTFDYLTQGTRYVTVSNGTVSSIDNLCPIGPGSVIATTSGYGSGIIEVSRGENSATMTPFYTTGRDWIDAKSSSNGQTIIAIRNFIVPEAAGKIELSSNYGVTFSNYSNDLVNNQNPSAVDITANGGKVVVVTNPGYLYDNLLAVQFGQFIAPRTALGSRNWKDVAVNASGTVAVAVASDGAVYRFYNGAWALANVGVSGMSWTCVTMNYDGSVIWIAGNNTHLYRSTDGGRNFAQVSITVTIPNIGSISSPFNFSNIATDNLGNNTVATVEPSGNSANLSFVAKNFIGGSTNYNNWAWGWGYTGMYPYNNIVNGNWTGLTVSSNAATIYAVNNHSTQGGLYVSYDNAVSFYRAGDAKPYSSISYVASQNCPASGTVLQEYCDGTTWVQVIANGSCGTYTTLETSSPNCQTCDTYSVFDYGYVSYIDCSGVNQYISFQPGDTFCALSLNFGPAFLYSSGCSGPGGGGFA